MNIDFLNKPKKTAVPTAKPESVSTPTALNGVVGIMDDPGQLGLSIQDMNELGALLRLCFTERLRSYDDMAQESIRSYFTELIFKTKETYFFNERNLAKLAERLDADDLILDFMLSWKYNFMLRWPNSGLYWPVLIAVIANANHPVPDAYEKSKHKVIDSLRIEKASSRNEMVDIMTNNPILVILMMAKVFIGLGALNGNGVANA